MPKRDGTSDECTRYQQPQAGYLKFHKIVGVDGRGSIPAQGSIGFDRCIASRIQMTEPGKEEGVAKLLVTGVKRVFATIYVALPGLDHSTLRS